MKILWITNTIFPEPCKKLGLPMPVLGGWMYGLAGQLAVHGNIELSIATVYPGNELQALDLNGIRYYLLPGQLSSCYQKHLETLWQQICHNVSPDVIHIHGTELPHGLACMRACPGYEFVISIQGLVGICARYYYAGLTQRDILTNITIRDIARCNTLLHARADFVKRGLFETECIKRTRHIIGRTSWDRTHTQTINPHVTYHHCNEILRDGFYVAAKWELRGVRRHSVFLSQATYPLKGLHQVLNAVALLQKDFPDILVRVAGNNILKNETLADRLKLSGYGSYIRRLVAKLGLQNRLEFTGQLTVEEMIAEYRKAHVFICPSSIENSPNSVGEAQLLGVPVIASYVGGVPDIITHGTSGLLYRFEEVEMLAESIRQVFTNNEFTAVISRQGIVVAGSRHNQAENCRRMIDVYDNIFCH